MVLYYGLFALETANSTAAAANAPTKPTTTTIPRAGSDRTSLTQKQKYLSNSIGKMPSSSLSSSNSWIYTEDLRKRFEERYADYRYVFVPVYIDKKSSRHGHSHSTTAILPQTIDRDNSWIYSRSLRDHLFNSTSKISLPLTTNISSSACCVTNHGFMRDELPVKKDSKIKFFKRSLSAKEDKTTNISLSSISSFSTTNNLMKHRTSDVVEEENDEDVNDNENHSIPLIKQDSMVPSSSSSSSVSTSRTTTLLSIDNNTNICPTTITNQLDNSTSISNKTKSSIKQTGTRNKKLTRLRSFFFKTSSPSTSSSRSRTPQKQQQEQTAMSFSSLSNRISRT